MSKTAKENLLSRLLGAQDGDTGEVWKTVQASQPSHDSRESNGDDDPRLAELLGRIQKITDHSLPEEVYPAESRNGQPDVEQVNEKPSPEFGEDSPDDDFVPIEPDSLPEAGLTDAEIEGIILKYLNARAEASGREVAEQVKLAFRLVDPLLHTMKSDRLVAHRGSSVMNDYVYEVTDLGRERARKLSQICSYFGSAPVTLEDYVASVAAQSIMNQQPTEKDLRHAFDDLLINQRMFRRLGPAINSGRGLFLFGPPGNGKTSIAERITRAFGATVWIPRAIGVDGEIMRLFDPSLHDEAPLSAGEGLIDKRKIDKRWIRIKRPTIVTGGELTMDALEVTLNTATNVSESPLQMKSNTGTLVIDDFGRQRMTTDELLNRWIVPLEKRYDFLNLASGKKIQVPFDQLIVFSTNLEPRDLVDDAFLRRIPYKIEVTDPTEEEFRQLFKIMAPIIDVAYDEAAIDYLISVHYKGPKRSFRCCQPRDLLSQIRNHCMYVGETPRMTNEFFDFAVENYFAVM